jgi:anti-anti-sigma factor
MSELARVEVEPTEDGCLVRIRGEVDISNAPLLLSAIEQEVPNSSPTMILDLSGTTYLDSAGVQLLFVLAQRLRDRRHTLRIIVPRQAPIRSLLEMTGLPILVPLEDGGGGSP